MNFDFWILRLSGNIYTQHKRILIQDEKSVYIKIPSNITYNQIFKLLLLIRHTYENIYDDGTIIIKKITEKQVSHILNYLFGYEIISKKGITNEYGDNRIKKISLSYLESESAELRVIKNKDEDGYNHCTTKEFFEIDNIDVLLDGDKYFYYRLQESHPFIKIEGEKEPLVFRDVNKIKEAISYVLNEFKHPEDIHIFDKILKKDVVCLMESLKGKKYYIVMDKGEGKDFYTKLSYIHILYSNKYRRDASETGLIKYPFYTPVEGNKKLKIEELIFLLDKIYGYKTLEEDEVEILNKGAHQGYYGYIHHGVEVHFSGSIDKSIRAWRHNIVRDYARPNVSRIILERQLELAPDNKKEYYSKKLKQIEERQEPEEIILSVIQNYK